MTRERRRRFEKDFKTYLANLPKSKPLNAPAGGLPTGDEGATNEQQTGRDEADAPEDRGGGREECDDHTEPDPDLQAS